MTEAEHLRLECLILAIEAGAEIDEAVEAGRAFEAFVLGQDDEPADFRLDENGFIAGRA